MCCSVLHCIPRPLFSPPPSISAFITHKSTQTVTCLKRKNKKVHDCNHTNFLKFVKPEFWQSRQSFPEAPNPFVSRESFHAERASALPDPVAAQRQTPSRCVTETGDVGGQFSDLTETKIGGYDSSESTSRSSKQEVPN